MNLLSVAPARTFTLLSIGQRGVGKTVFLAGGYAELHRSGTRTRSRQMWFDCQNSDSQKNIENVLSYVEQRGKYPPATLKVTDFDFKLKRQGLLRAQTLCQFCWQDVPGESCHSGDTNFQKTVLASHGCCVFVDAYAAVHDKDYLPRLADIFKQVSAIASLAYMNGLDYPFAIVFTKCDLLGSEVGGVDPLHRQRLEEGITPLTNRLAAVGAHHQVFHSSIPMHTLAGMAQLEARGGAAPILWLVHELHKVYNLGLTDLLMELLARLLPGRHHSRLAEG
ncbi:MAG: hypothetical protein H7Y22_00590 [Gemmatimonadaceae bacterium]|nr:hypothetical protein [Gloeobacterales cyanobacterium ES-bin-141]